MTSGERFRHTAGTGTSRVFGGPAGHDVTVRFRDAYMSLEAVPATRCPGGAQRDANIAEGSMASATSGRPN